MAQKKKVQKISKPKKGHKGGKKMASSRKL